MRTLALPEEMEHGSLTTLREKLVKIGAKVVSHGRYVTFQPAEVAAPRSLFRKILSLIDDLRPIPACALAKNFPETVSSDSSNHDLIRTIIQTLRNRAIGWLRKVCSSLGGGPMARFPRIFMSAGECRVKEFSTGYPKPKWAGWGKNS